MKRNKKASRIIAVGMLLFSGVLIFGHYFNLSDKWMGFLQGVGFGIMIMGLIKMRKENR